MVELSSLIAVAVMIGCLAYPLVKKALASITIAIGLFVIFAIEIADDPAVMVDLAFRPIYLQTGTDIYTIFTASFLHGGFFHIFSNVFMLVIIGLVFEERIGTRRYLAIFVIAGIVGNLAFGLLNMGSYGFVVGASGAISGILGAILMLYPRERTGMMVFPIPVQNLPVWALVAMMMAWQIFFILDPSSHVAWEGHIGGFVAGAVSAPLLMRANKGRERAMRGQPIDIMLFANTTKEKEIVERIRSESFPDVRDAWIKELAKTAKCPLCGAKMAGQKGGLRCAQGHRFRMDGG